MFPSEVTDFVGVAASDGCVLVGVGRSEAGLEPLVVAIHPVDAVELASAIVSGQERLAVGVPVYGVDVTPVDDGSGALVVGCVRDGVRRISVVGHESLQPLVMALCDAVALCEGGEDVGQALSDAADRLVELATRAGVTSQYPLHLVASGMEGVPVQ